MRKWSQRLARLVLLLCLFHALTNSFLLLGWSTVSVWPVALVLLGAVLLHAVLGILLTIPALKRGKASGAWYLRQNAGFWTKRISGLAILLLLGFHLTAYVVNCGGTRFFREFTPGNLLSQLLLLLAIFVHLAVSVKPMLIARGCIRWKERTIDWMLVLSLLLLFFAVAVIGYTMQWQG